MTSGIQAISKAFGGEAARPAPKQAARLPIPPDAHDDDALIKTLAKAPIAESIHPEHSGKGTATQPAKVDKKSATAPAPEASDAPASAMPSPLDVRSVGDLVALVTAVGQSTKTILTASFDPSYTRVAAPTEPSKRVRETKSATTVDSQKPAPSSSAKSSTKRSAPSPWNAEGTAATPPSNARMDRLKRRIDQTLAVYKRRPLNTQEHTPWEVMHGFLPFGISAEVRVGGPRGGVINAIGWLNSGGRCRGQTMLATEDGRIVALKGVGVQGHSAQYLAILAQCRVAASSPLTPERKAFTVADLIEQEKLDCESNTELTFALIGLAHYLPTDATWTSRDGQTWSLERLVEEELQQPIRGAPCGGTHRLFGLAYGCQRRLRATGSLDGIYERADAFVREYQLMTLTKLQNPDGSFSTEWYKFPTAQNREDDIDRKIQTTGHMLEWLVASIDQQSLYHPRVTRSVEFLTWALASEPTREWSVGPMCHALHALAIYQERVWGVVLPGAVAAFKGPMKARPAHATVQMAEAPAKSTKPRDGNTSSEEKRPSRH